MISKPGFAAVAVITADCAPVAIWTSDGIVGVIHAGWRGLVAGVIEATVAAVRSRTDDPASVRAVLGPCIGSCCYEFGTNDLDAVAAIYGNGVRATTDRGSPALDLRAGVLSALQRSDAEFVNDLGSPGAPTEPACTACGSDWFSWRRNRDLGRQALIVQSGFGQIP